MGNCINKRKQERSPSPEEPPSRRPPAVPPGGSHTHKEPIVANPIVVALFDFNPRSHSELVFRKGDKLEILSNSGEDWWRAQHLKTNKTGYIPVAYVALVTSLESQDWFFGQISREEAENLLLSSFNRVGAFLVRSSQSDSYSHKHTISARVSENPRQKRVRHYRVFTTRDGYFFISETETFLTLNDLVDAHVRNKVKDAAMSAYINHACNRTAPTINDLSADSAWEISPDTIQMGKTLGQGSFGEVLYGTWNNSVPVAIKKLKKDTMTREEFLEEATIMKTLRHKHILALYAVCSLQDPILIITEYMCNGSLLDYLRNEENFDIQSKIYIAAQVASGMNYLEAKQLIHRDLAARNVLVGDSLLCKISDFGLARLLQGDEYNITNNKKFPVKWTAPEAFLRDCYSIKSDVWSYGILLMEIITNGAIPYPGINNQDVMDDVPNGMRMAKPQKCPDKIYEIAYDCWLLDAHARPTFEFIAHALQNFSIHEERSYDEAPDYRSATKSANVHARY